MKLDTWIAEYRPISNSFGDRGWVIDGKPILFETYDEDLEFVRQQPENHVWTWMDGDEGTFIGAGFAYVNRIGYFITEKPWSRLDEEIEVD